MRSRTGCRPVPAARRVGRIPSPKVHGLMAAPDPKGGGGNTRRGADLSITTALVFGFGSLIVGGMLLVLGISLWTAQENTFSLLAANARIGIQFLSSTVQQHLEPVEEINSYVVRLIDSGQVDVDDSDQLEETLLAAMAGTKQVYGMGFTYPDGRIFRVRRGRGAYHMQEVPETGDHVSSRVATAREQSTRPFWTGPRWADQPGLTLLVVRTAIRMGGKFRGFLGSTVSVNELSEVIARSSDQAMGANRFILYGRTHVLAHRNMVARGHKRNVDVPLPLLNEVGDPVLAALWETEGREDLQVEIGSGINGHSVLIDGQRHVFLYRALEGFGKLPLTIGIYVGPDDGLGSELQRIAYSAIAGAVIMISCIIAAVMIGRRVSAPVRMLASGSRAIADFEFDRVDRLRPSRLRELDEAASAFNRMTTGLRWFQTYVPKHLVRRLIEQDSAVTSEERQITVMFTDIAGFSTLSERMSAADTASLLNEHFSILVRCIEAESGIVDKYIGDSVMAFWDPDSPGTGVDQALRAARSIRTGMTEANRQQRDGGRASIRLRIGIHTGRAIVGNVGPEGRLNYTVVGDAVNVTARLEELCKEVVPEAETAVLVSGNAAVLSTDRNDLVFRGRYPVRGRDSDIKAYEMRDQG